MELDEKYRSLMLAIHSEWKKSEACIKEAEQINGTVIFPAVKELRYAGRRVVDALYLICTEDKDEKIVDFLLDAKFDANRARHDAVDAIVSKVAIETENIIKSNNVVAIKKFFPQIQDFIDTIIEVQQKIVDSRGEVDNRNSAYDEIEKNQYPKLLNFYRQIESKEIEIKTYSLSLQEKTTYQVRWAYTICAIGVVFGLFCFARLYMR